jgi:wyosine [tRNA(Phe)-imidazoG37] synthetase (radical SAM superfamily)
MDHALPILDPAARRAFSNHARLWHDNRYVYPVVSRRSKGLSLGINLNPDQICNFDCIYCSVNRKSALPPWATRDVDLTLLREELAHMLDLVGTGTIYTFDPFNAIPAELRRVNDIAFSGDGEPTTCPQFEDAVHSAAQLVEAHHPQSPSGSDVPIKLVLITNATRFHNPAVRQVLAFLDGHNGEIWAKLDAGTADYFHLIDRTGVPFTRILQNLAWCCQTRPTVIQTLLMKVHGKPPAPAEIAAYVRQLQTIRDAGGAIKLVQLYTVARDTTEPYVTALSPEELEGIAHAVQTANFPAETYP